MPTVDSTDAGCGSGHGGELGVGVNEVEVGMRVVVGLAAGMIICVGVVVRV